MWGISSAQVSWGRELVKADFNLKFLTCCYGDLTIELLRTTPLRWQSMPAHLWNHVTVRWGWVKKLWQVGAGFSHLFISVLSIPLTQSVLARRPGWCYPEHPASSCTSSESRCLGPWQLPNAIKWKKMPNGKEQLLSQGHETKYQRENTRTWKDNLLMLQAWREEY